MIKQEIIKISSFYFLQKYYSNKKEAVKVVKIKITNIIPSHISILCLFIYNINIFVGKIKKNFPSYSQRI